MSNQRSFGFLAVAIFVLLMLAFPSCTQSGVDNTNMTSATNLPFDLTLDPDPDFKGGFTIRESDGFALVGKGVSYRDIDLQVAELVGYGVQKEALAAEVIDTAGNTKFIQVTKQPSPSLQPYHVAWATEAEVKQSKAYTWVALADQIE